MGDLTTTLLISGLGGPQKTPSVNDVINTRTAVKKKKKERTPPARGRSNSLFFLLYGSYAVPHTPRPDVRGTVPCRPPTVFLWHEKLVSKVRLWQESQLNGHGGVGLGLWMDGLTEVW